MNERDMQIRGTVFYVSYKGKSYRRIDLDRRDGIIWQVAYENWRDRLAFKDVESEEMNRCLEEKFHNPSTHN